MRSVVFKCFDELRSLALPAALMLFSGTFLSLPLIAQQDGPMSVPPPPPPRAQTPRIPPAPTPPPPQKVATRRQSSSGISNQPPAIPVEQIVQRFAEREAEFR